MGVRRLTTFRIGLPIVPHVDLLDIANAYEIFRWLAVFWKGTTVETPLIGPSLDPVVTGNGARLLPDTTFGDVAKDNVQFDLIFVPGGGNDYLDGATADETLLDFVIRQAGRAQWVTSVCTGAFVLARAGLLEGKQCTTHWQYIERLQKEYPKVKVVNGWPRLVADGNVVTGGGLSSSIDETLWLCGQVAGESVGKQIELLIQYNPQPPWNVGDPAIADYATYVALTGG